MKQLSFYIYSIFIFIYVFIVNHNVVIYSGFTNVSEIPLSLITFVVSMFFFVNGIRYYVEWEKLNNKSVMLKILGVFIIPYSTLFWFLKYNIYSILNQNIIFISSLILFFVYFFLRKHIYEFIGEKMPVNEKDKKILFSAYPPTTRIDLIRLDIFMIFMWALPLVFNF